MLTSSIGHIVIHIRLENVAFYKDLLCFLGWQIIYEDLFTVGLADAKGASLWFAEAPRQTVNDYDGIGMNHLGISVPNQADVDKTVQYLAAHAVPTLFETPRHRPDFSSDPEHTYYQVMFATPDNLLLEVVYTGPLAS